MPPVNTSVNFKDQVAAYFEKNANAMTSMAAREMNCPEAQVVRHLPGNRSTEMIADQLESMLKRVGEFGDVHVIVTNSVTTIEAFGSFGGLSKSGPWLNVQSGTLDMHIRSDQIGSVFAVEKPSHMDGISTLSLQFYNHDGDSGFKVFLTFGKTAPTEETVNWWNNFREEFKKG